MAWITDADVITGLGDQTVVDPGWLAEVTPAADAWAQRKRVQAGYIDDPDVPPDAAAKTGTVLYAVALYRERASADSYRSFDELAAGPLVVGAMGQINRLLGVSRAAVDTPLYGGVVTPFRARRAIR